MKEKALLKECIELLLEDDGYGGMAMGADALGPWGVHVGSGDQLYNVFIKPFVDVAKVAGGKTKELSVRGQNVARVAFESVATTLIPMLSSDYDQIFAKEKEELDKIKSEYKDVYDATWDAFKDNDIAMAAFMYSPAAVIGAKMVEEAPEQAVKLVSVLTGGTIDDFLHRVAKAFKLGSGKPSSDKEGPGVAFESELQEDGEQSQQKKTVGSVLTQKKLLQKIASNPRVQRMQSDTQAQVNNALATIVKHAQGAMSAKSLDELEKKLKKKVPKADELKKLPEQERVAAETAMLTNMKKSAKEFYAKNLSAQAKNALDAGVPENHPFIQAYKKAISQIKAA